MCDKVLKHVKFTGAGEHMSGILDDQQTSLRSALDRMKLAGPDHKQITLFQCIGF